MSHDSSEARQRERSPALRLIALFKFSKASLLLAVALGAWRLLDPSVAARAQQWAAALADSSGLRVVQHLLTLAAGISPGQLELVAVAALLYAALFTTEGVGLWRSRRWAEYLTVVSTAGFVPIEVFEVLRRVDALRVAGLLANLAVTVYLANRLRRARAAG